VFLYFVGAGVMSTLTPIRFDTITGQRAIMDRKWLLGVDWGHLPTTQDILDQSGKPVSEGWKVAVNTGMAAVVPAWKLTDLLDLEEVVRSRRELDDAEDRAGGVLDVNIPPRGMTETADLMGKLLQVPKEEADEVRRGHGKG
jgi:Ethanolamine utilization protein EutJ (predicted chaperonin)